jgi:lysophospholipase L1-like esterase
MANMHPRALKRTLVAFISIASLMALVIVPASSVAAQDGTNLPAERVYDLKYVALGDSVAAGLGLPLAADATAEDAVCGRSPQAYSAVVAAGITAKLHKTHVRLSYNNVACQGAVVANLTQPQTRGALTVQPQLDKAFAGGAPHLITLTMGANDVHWAEFIGGCFSAADCSSAVNTAAAQAYIHAMQTQLASVLSNIRSRSTRLIPPITVVTGYYKPVSALCVNPNLTAGEVNWLNSITDEFNAALQATADDAGWFTKFAPVDFTGHDICSADPWIQRPGAPNEPAPFHPTTRGQEEIGKDVLNALNL